MSRLKRFYYNAALSKGEYYALPKRLLKHICEVMRLREGAEILLFDPKGKEFLCKLKKISGKFFAYTIEELKCSEPLLTYITLCQSIIRLPRMDLLIEKTTELGVSAIQPIYAQRTNVNLKNAKYRTARWRKITEEASRQSGRLSIPEIFEIKTTPDYLEAAHSTGLGLLLQKGAENKITDVLRSEQNKKSITIAVGPEGGFTDEEVARFIAHGFVPVKVGHFTLRAETAGIVAVGIVANESA